MINEINLLLNKQRFKKIF